MPLILFILSFLVLSLEVLETKIFAYSLDNTLIFLVIGVVLLGFGAGGTVLALKPKLDDPRPLVRRNLFWTAGLLIVAHAWFALHSDRVHFGLPQFAWSDIKNLHDAAGTFGPLILTLSILVLLASPYFTAGMAISALLADAKGNVHARYGINLLGSALGCVSIFFALGPLSGPQCLAACAITCAVLGALLCRQKVAALVVVALLGTPTFTYIERVLPYKRQPSPGQLSLIQENAKQLVAKDPDVQDLDVEARFDRWDPTARVEVHGLKYSTTNAAYRKEAERLPTRWFTQDSSYGSPLLGAGESAEAAEAAKGVYERTVYGAGYFRRTATPDVLVIGLGGAPDVQTALHHDPARVDGVDINRTTIDMVKGPQAEFLGKPYDDPRVHLHVQDGRSFVRASDRRYDLIQLSGVDTKSLLAAGTLALNESYLYTREAFADYIGHLKDGGILCINYSGGEHRDRLAVTAMTVLREDFGSEKPESHLIMVEQSAIFCFMVKRTPFTKEECAQLDQWLVHADSNGAVDADGKPVTDGLTDVTVMVYELLNPGLSLNKAPTALYLPDGRPTDVEVMNRAAKGPSALATYVAARPELIEPAPDARPFFFNLARNEDIWNSYIGANPQSSAFSAMFNLLFIMVGLSVLLITGPLLVFGARHAGATADATAPIPLGEQFVQPFRALSSGIRQTIVNIPFAAYFACLGAGFVLAMSGLIQRYVLFLGHQAYAFSVVIGGLLVAAGLGSFVSGWFKRAPHRAVLVATLVIVAALAGIHYGLDRVFGATAHLPHLQRIGVALLVLLPLGIPMGMMFPTGLAAVKRSSPVFVPWAFGINGVFSVIGSTLVLPGSIMFGFPAMSAAAAIVYAVAGLLGFVLIRPAPKPATAPPRTAARR